MKKPTRNLLFSVAICGLLLTSSRSGLAGLPPAVAEKPAPKPVLTAEQITKLLDELGADKFTAREAAMRQLRDVGAPAIAPLVQAAGAGNLEVTLRVFRVLESLYTTGSLEESEAAEVALEKLRQSDGQSVVSRAEAVLASMGEVRERRAIVAIARLGGIPETDEILWRGRPGQLPAGERPVTTVILNPRWKGKEDGLKYLPRLRFLQTVYVIEGVLSDDAIDRLERSLPNSRVQLRGKVCLGVAGGPHELGCQITYTKPNSAAFKAGLQGGDIIVAFAGKPGPDDKKPLDFDTLVNLIKQQEPGDKVPVKILRTGKELTLEVVLDEWKKAPPLAISN